ncbi:hypothetical protein BDF19DRAFT_420646 [Syncephalis fuscata]|nr:hypothetical protein BDF19DRAFT_420646 [Syncephalis fuscata]
MLSSNDTLSKIWLSIELVQYIARFCDISAIIALSRTCTSLHSTLVNNKIIWYNLYKRDFPLNSDLKINWLQWRLTCEQSLLKGSEEPKNTPIKEQSWVQRYVQRKRLHHNWMKNRIISSSKVITFQNKVPLNCRFKWLLSITSCPGWIVSADYASGFAYLIEIVNKKPAILHKLDWPLSYSATMSSCCLEREILQLWNVKNRQLVRSILIRHSPDREIISPTIFYFNNPGASSTAQHHLHGSITIIRDIFSNSPCEQPIITIPTKSQHGIYVPQMNDKDNIYVLHCLQHEGLINYDITHTSTKSLSGKTTINESHMTTTNSGRLNTIGDTYSKGPNVVRIDQNRVLVSKITCIEQGTITFSQQITKAYIAVISIPEGLIWENNSIEYEFNFPSLLVISLLNGEMLRRIDISAFHNSRINPKHIIDTLIFVRSPDLNQYCIVDVATGEWNVHSFSIPSVKYFSVTPGHMLIGSENELLVIGFEPEFH